MVSTCPFDEGAVLLTNTEEKNIWDGYHLVGNIMLSQQSNKSALLVRFSLVAIANTAVGYGVIFMLMALGANPYWSNLAGYTVGMTTAFILHRGWVFQAYGRLSSQSIKYSVSAMIAFFCNIAMLKVLIQIDVWPYAAQILAGVTYAGIVFLLSTYWAFATHVR
jgi:putative flippase GtrA